jgi:NADPH-dependent 2,4-dienoyl-CoA reductase/sulfur reductase-like enzyme
LENGYETRRKITPAIKKKNVYVVGGGPAGLEAARVAATKGHQVTLFEKSTKLGGQLNIASIPPRKTEMRRAINYLSQSVQSLGITLRMGEKVSQEAILEEKPDAVIVACGAKNMIPKIPGADKAIVCDAWKVLDGTQQVYGTVVVIGGGLVGCETAEYLCTEQGCEVRIIEMLDTIAKGESNTILPTLMNNFKKYGVISLTGQSVKEITEKSVICQDDGNNISEISCDFVVIAAGAKPVEFPIDKLEASGIQVVKVGDCNERALDIENAIKTGYDASNQI